MIINAEKIVKILLSFLNREFWEEVQLGILPA
jgi:hypothetical protein